VRFEVVVGQADESFVRCAQGLHVRAPLVRSDSTGWEERPGEPGRRARRLGGACRTSRLPFPDGSARTLPVGSTVADLAADIGPGLAKAALIGEVDGSEVDLTAELADGQTVSIVTDRSDQGLFAIRHSTAHVLAQAVLELYPGATFAIGPPIENGFYYDFELPAGQTSPTTTSRPSRRRCATSSPPTSPSSVTRSTPPPSAALFADHPYKREIIEVADASELADAGVITTYRNTDDVRRSVRGPHVPSTGVSGTSS
jgi:threonyl-tRNA synthetase